MKSIQILISILMLAYAGINLKSQTNNDTVRITYKGKGVTVKPQGDESNTTVRFKDTLAKKDIVVKVSVKDLEDDEKEAHLDSSIKKTINLLSDKNKSGKRRFIETSWGTNLDLGFTSTNNDIENSNVYNPKFTKSANIAFGLVKQDMNLYKGRVLLSYGFGFNNYYLKYNNRQTIQNLDKQGYLTNSIDSMNTFRKNRMDIHYFTIPVMLEYHSKNDQFNVAAGVEYSFGGRTTNVTKGTYQSMDFKHVEEAEIKINPTQINAVVRVGSDHLAVYARYSITDMYQNSAYAANTNPHQHLFSVGICLLGI